MKGDDVNPNDDMKYQDVINTLGQLQQVKAPAGFEADLMRRINAESFPEEKTFWQNIFAPSRLSARSSPGCYSPHTDLFTQHHRGYSG